MSDEESTANQEALLKWINHGADTAPVKSLGELKNGFVLWNILCDLDPSFFYGALPYPQVDHPEYWIATWHNLRYICKTLKDYFRGKRITFKEPDDTFPNAKQIAASLSGASDETAKLIKFVIMVAGVVPKPQSRHAQELQRFAREEELIDPIMDEFGFGYRGKDSTGFAADDIYSPSRSTSPVDRELLYEQRLGELVGLNKELKAANDDLEQEGDHMRARLEKLEREKQVWSENSENMSDATRIRKRLELRIIDQDNLISQQEHKISDRDKEIESQQRQVQELRLESTKAQHFQDRLDEMKYERDELRKKANFADRLRQKLEMLQGLEQEVKILHTEVEKWKGQAQQNKSALQAAQTVVEEYCDTVSKIERDISENRLARERAERERDDCNNRWESMNEDRFRDTEMISELQDQLRALELANPPITPCETLHSQLLGFDQKEEEEEEQEQEQEVGREEEERSRSETLESDQNRENGDQEAPPILFRHLLDDARSQARKFEALYLEAMEKNTQYLNDVQAIAEDSSSDDLSPTPFEMPATTTTKARLPSSTRRFIRLRESLRATQMDVSMMGRKCRDLEIRLLKTSTELATTKTELNLMDKEKLEEVREAVNQELPVLAALRTEREELSKRVRDMQIELDENKSLLTLSLMEGHMVHRALLDHKDDLRAAEKEQNAYKLALEKARQAGGTSADDRPATELDERLAQIAQLYQENQNLKQQLVDIEKYIADQERVVKEKQQQLESPSDQGRSDVAKSQAPALALSPDHGRPWASVGSSARPAAVASSEAAVSGPEAVSVPSRPAAPSAAPAAPPTAGHERWREAATLDTSASQRAHPRPRRKPGSQPHASPPQPSHTLPLSESDPDAVDDAAAAVLVHARSPAPAATNMNDDVKPLTTKTTSDQGRHDQEQQQQQQQQRQHQQQQLQIPLLERELRLMSTAWYSLSNRIQMPTVNVQRRSEAPRSWLNQRRRELDQATAGVSSFSPPSSSSSVVVPPRTKSSATTTSRTTTPAARKSTSATASLTTDENSRPLVSPSLLSSLS